VSDRDGRRAALVAEIRAQGGLLAGMLEPRSADGAPGPAQVAAAGPRAAEQADEYELIVELVHEGYLLHYGEPRVLRSADPDLVLLAGDQLYALGLARLARLGDLPAVAELADVISLCAQAHAASEPDLAEAVWEAGAVAVGWGAGPDHEAAKAAARALEPGAAQALRAVARQASGNLAPTR
jgi:hypothetical protein